MQKKTFFHSKKYFNYHNLFPACYTIATSPLSAPLTSNP